MKKKLMGYMAVGMLAMAVMVQAQPASRPGRSLKPGDSTERMSPMRRLGTMNGPRTGVVRPGQFGQRDSVKGRAPMRRMEPSRGMQGGMRQMPQYRGGMAPFGGRSMQRGGAITAPRNRDMRQGTNAPGFGQRNGQQGLQRGFRPGMQQGQQRGMRQGFQPASSANPEVRISQEVDQLKKSLNLTDDQVKKITAIKEKQAKKEIKAYKKAQKKAADRRKKLQAPNDKIKSVLTDEQIKKWESNRSVTGAQRFGNVRPGFIQR